MRPLKKYLPPAVDRDEVLRAARAYRVLREWPMIVGDTLGARSCPDRYDRGKVFVAVEGSAWAQELRLAKPKILARLAERSGDITLFADLRFGVRPFEAMPVPEEPEPLTVEPPVDETRSIREIADARMRAWRADRV